MQMGMNQTSGGEDCEKKMFVGGISAGTTVEHVRDYFVHTYGVTEVEVEFKYDKATQRMRGFGFVTLDSPDQVTRVCQKRFHEINGKSVEVKKAQPRQATASGMALAQMRQSQQSVSPYGYQGYGGTDYSQTNGQQAYQQAFYSNGQYYGYDTTAAAQAAAAAGYGQYGGAAGGGYAGYDPSAYAHSQSSGGSRQNTQNYYQQHGTPYGHGGAQQLQTSGYRQDASAYTAARTTSYTSQDAAAYGGQSAYGGGGASTGAQQPTGHYQPGSSSYGNQ